MASWPAAARRRFGWLAAAGGRPEIPTVKPYAWLAFLLLARLALGLAYSIAIPAGEAPDEADHLAYAAYIAREHRLPQGAEMTQAKHPPLYHALAAAVGGRAGMDTSFLRANPDVGFTADAAPNFFVHTTLEDWPWRDGPLAMHLARLVSVLAGVGLVAAVYALGVAVWPRRPDLALAAAAFVAFLPESLFIAAAMNNDSGRKATNAAAASARSGRRGHTATPKAYTAATRPTPASTDTSRARCMASGPSRHGQSSRVVCTKKFGAASAVKPTSGLARRKLVSIPARPPTAAASAW